MSGNYLYDRLFPHDVRLDRPALIMPERNIWIYGELAARSARLAHVLVDRGVKPGDRLAVQIEKSPEAIALYLAALRAGAALLPLNTAYTPAEVEYFLGDAEPSLFVCDPARAAILSPIAARAGASVETLGAKGEGSLLEGANGQSAQFDNLARGTGDLAGILYTSGTTGRSKGAMISHRNLASNAEVLRDYWRFTADDALIHALPIYHTHGLFVAVNTLLMAGGSMIFLPKFDADAVFAAMAGQGSPRATALMGVPTFYTRLLEDPRLTRQAVAGMRLFISGSAPLLAETHREWRARTGKAILERYGMTETNMLTSNPCEGERVAGTVGFPLPGVSLRIADPETGAPTPRSEIGMIEVKGENVFSGYWRMPDKTRAEFRPDGFFITGDLGQIDEAGYVHIVGRGKDLVITGGFNVYPKEVEGEIDALPGIVESAVIGLPHKDFGEVVAAVVVREKGANVDERSVKAALAERLAKFKQPKAVIFVQSLPRNTMGKVQKNLLRETYKELFATPA